LQIQAYNAGKPILLPVGNGGAMVPLQVEVHLACDLKNLHVLYQVPNSPNAHKQNLYDEDLHEHAGDLKYRPQITREVLETACLDIPLERVHFCAMHCEMRIVENVLNHCIKLVWEWSSDDPAVSTAASAAIRLQKIAAIEGVLQRAGVYGGRCKLLVDEKRGKADARPHKPISMNGGMCRKMTEDRVFLDIVEAMNVGCKMNKNLTRKVLRVWYALRILCLYLRGTRFTDEAPRDAWDRTITKFMKVYISCFEPHRVTRYMHLLYCQGKYFLDTYGAFGIWSAQAMEKSHWREKNNYMAKTNKGGGVMHICPLYQLTHLSFRNLMHAAYAAKLRKHIANVSESSHHCTDEVLQYQEELTREEEEAEESAKMLCVLEGLVEGVEEFASEGLVLDEGDEWLY
jgi:hypothetical protein